MTFYIFTNYILIIYELFNFDHVVGVVSQTRVSGGNRTHGPHVNSLAHYSLDYPDILINFLVLQGCAQPIFLPLPYFHALIVYNALDITHYGII